jgi:hypothetical protein
MSKHTPGPWVVNDFCTEGGADTAVWTSHDPHTAKSICECHFNTLREIKSGESGCHQLEAEANAKLIAAAPELLEACKTMAEWFRKEKAGFGQSRDTPEGEAKWRDWWDEQLRLCDQSETLANAAIAKATGEA